MILDDVEAAFRKYVVYPNEHALVAVSLWTAHTWLYEHGDSTPRLVLLSPEKQSGKTRTFEVLSGLVRKAIRTENVSVAALYTLATQRKLTFLVDEVDAVFGRDVAKHHEDLRSFINAGHRQGNLVYRVSLEGKKRMVEEFDTFAPVALAGLYGVPDTIADRAVTIQMRRREPTEYVVPFELREATPYLQYIQYGLKCWSEEVEEAAAAADPELPEGLRDRPADIWRPLLVVADICGGEWPARAREAAVWFTEQARSDESSWGIMLLKDIRDYYLTHEVEQVASQVLVDWLVGLETSPWGGMDKPLSKASLAFRLKNYQIIPKRVRQGEWTGRGYLRADFEDTWRRYLTVPESFLMPPEVARLIEAGVVPQTPEIRVAP